MFLTSTLKETDVLLRILQVDKTGAPVAWLKVKEAAGHQVLGKVAWSLGDTCMTLHGGTNALTGLVTTLDIHPIISVKGEKYKSVNYKTPSLSAKLVKIRDRNLCAYCGQKFEDTELTLDHILPQSRKGPNSWLNLVTSCKRCNSVKADKTPEEANMPLLYLPYVPNIYETFILRNRTILADQMDFLLRNVPKHSRLRPQ